MAKSLKTIVIGTLLNEMSDGIVRTGVRIAQAAGASPWLVHSYALPAFPSELGSADGTWIEEQLKSLREALVDQARRTGLTNLEGFRPGQLRLEMGPAQEQIVELARRIQADLIIVGTAGGGILHRAFVGATADGVIRKASCPVLVVRPESAFPPARVEIPVDLSPISANAFRQGLDFLAQLGVPLAETEALFILNPLEVGGSLQFTPEQIERFASDELRRFLAANGEGVSPGLARVRTGYPQDEIVSILEQRKADLVVLGTHGRRGFERLLLGSTAAAVMHRAPCSLLVVPPDASLRHESERGEVRTGADWEFVADEEPALADTASN